MIGHMPRMDMANNCCLPVRILGFQVLKLYYEYYPSLQLSISTKSVNRKMKNKFDLALSP